LLLPLFRQEHAFSGCESDRRLVNLTRMSASSLLLAPSPRCCLAGAGTRSPLGSPSFPRANRTRRLSSLNPLPLVVLDRKKAGGVAIRSAPHLSVRCASLPPLAELAPAASAVYGTLLLGGGLFAYARSGSKGSIAGGLTGAALMAAAYYLMQNPETKAAGDALGFGSAALFSAVFGIRLAATRKLVPSGLLLGLSAGALVLFVSAYMQDKV
ncbi:hypothetical protein Taro_018810, partial [Colocasia esculenta]|nr:hypothetical protein [Colocasia esculenta]